MITFNLYEVFKNEFNFVITPLIYFMNKDLFFDSIDHGPVDVQLIRVGRIAAPAIPELRT